jgi:formate dehydrogenase major subunit
MGLDISSLPAYYGLTEGAWRHFSRVWDVEFEAMVDRFGLAGMSFDEKKT